MAYQNERFEKEKMLHASEKDEKKNVEVKDKLGISVKLYGFNEKEKPRTADCKKFAIICLIVLNLLLMVGLLLLVVKWRENRIKSLEPREQTICVQCQDVGLNPQNMSKQVKGKVSVEGNNSCCGYTSTILTLLVSKAIKDRGTSVISSSNLFETKECKTTRKEVPSAQMSGIEMSKLVEGNTEVIHWNETGNSFTNGVTYSDGRISIKQSGYYYVFAQINFKVSASPSVQVDLNDDSLSLNERVPSHLDLYIYHYSSRDAKTQKILESSKSSCEVPSYNGETTSSIGAVFYLAENDQVYVNTSHPLFLVPSNERNHFGVYLT